MLNNGGNGFSFGIHCVEEEDRIPLLEGYGQALKQEDCFSCVLGDDYSALLLLLLLLCVVQTGDECCATQLIDSSRERVVLETSRAIDEGTYRAVQLRVCTEEPVTVQLWRQIDSTTYELRWQKRLVPTARQTMLSHITVWPSCRLPI